VSIMPHTTFQHHCRHVPTMTNLPPQITLEKLCRCLLEKEELNLLTTQSVAMYTSTGVWSST
jgi:hypothetical protein